MYMLVTTRIILVFKAVAESAVVPISHEVKGEALYCFVTLKVGEVLTHQLELELKHKGMCIN